jgi:hypothetical protein
LVKVFAATATLVRLGLAVARRPALQDVADINILAPHSHGGDDARQELTRNADEWLATAVFIRSGCFAHEADVDVDGAGAEDRLRPGGGQLRTTGAVCDPFLQLPQFDEPFFSAR